MRCVVDVVLPTGAAVLNADDPAVAGMAEKCKGAVVYFSRRADNELVVAHRAQNGRAVELRATDIFWLEGPTETPLGTLTDFNVAQTDDPEIDGLLAALAAARFLNLPTVD